MATETGTVADSLRLAKYLVTLVLDDRRLNVHVEDPKEREAMMNAAKLSEEEKRLLTTACFVQLCDYLEKAWKAPGPIDHGPPPSGG